MHERNPYKTPADFKELAMRFPEFKEIVTLVRSLKFVTHKTKFQLNSSFLAGYKRKVQDRL